MAETAGKSRHQRRLSHSETSHTQRPLVFHSHYTSPWTPHSQGSPKTCLWRLCQLRLQWAEGKRAYFGCRLSKARCRGSHLRWSRKQWRLRVQPWLKNRGYEECTSFREIELMIILAQNLWPVSLWWRVVPIFWGFTAIVIKHEYLGT